MPRLSGGSEARQDPVADSDSRTTQRLQRVDYRRVNQVSHESLLVESLESASSPTI